MINIADAIKRLKQEVSNPSKGLPDDLFHYISSTTPIINVDLLLKDENGRTLLAWRNDQFHEQGWHVPGGIIRFKETIKEKFFLVQLIISGSHSSKVFGKTAKGLHNVIILSSFFGAIRVLNEESMCLGSNSFTQF